MTSFRCLSLAVPFSLSLLWCPLAIAGGGMLEINQTCAVTTGCFPGDDPLFPVTITASAPGRSFVLSSDLSVPDVNTTAIEITQEHVTVDLRGFAIVGPTVCSGFPVDCAPTGTGRGINSSATGVAVRGGTVRGVGGSALDLSGGGIVENMRVYENAGNGIRVPGGVVRNSVVSRNRVTGISLPRVVQGCSVEQNRGAGIALNTGTAVDNTVYQNGGDGISVSGESTIRSNTISRNGLYTIGDGVDCNSRCNIIDNFIQLNSGVGIEASAFTFSRTSYHGNRISDNTLGVASGQLVDQGQNLCTDANSILTCP